jgi:hypothetical protein
MRPEYIYKKSLDSRTNQTFDCSKHLSVQWPVELPYTLMLHFVFTLVIWCSILGDSLISLQLNMQWETKVQIDAQTIANILKYCNSSYVNLTSGKTKT